MFLHSLGKGVGGMFRSYMIEDKICLNHFRYEDSVCRNLDSGEYEVEEDHVDHLTSVYDVYQRWLIYLPSIVIILFLGVWSDMRGRSVPLLIPLFGSFLMSFGFLLNAIWWEWPSQFTLVSYLPFGISGGTFSLSVAVYSYVSDDSENKTRTMRLSLVATAELLAVPLGKAAGTGLYNRYGYNAIFGTQVIIYAMAMAYVVLWVHPHPKNSPNKHHDIDVCNDRSDLVMSEQDATSLDVELATGNHKVCSMSSVKRTFLLAFGSRERGRRGLLLSNFAIISITVFARGGSQLFSLYTSKRFDWDDDDNYEYAITNSFASVIGVCIVLPLLSYYLKAEDALLGFVGSVSTLFHDIMAATAPYSWVLYLASAVSMCSSMTVVSARGALSKLVENDELGSLFALLALGDTFLPLISTPLYTFVFNTTIDSFPGSMFIITALLAVVVCCLQVWILTRDENKFVSLEDSS